MNNVLVTGNLTVIGTDNIVPNPIMKCAILSDEKSSGTSGGTSSNGQQNRTLNTLVDPSNIITLDGGFVTFTFNETGTYSIFAQIPGYKCNRHQAYLATSAGTILLIGSSEYTWSGSFYENVSLISDQLVVSSTSQAYKIIQYQQTGRTDGLGFPVGSGAGESYSKITIIKLSD